MDDSITILEPIAAELATPIDLQSPLRWKIATSAEQKLMENLQGNILKGHGRDHTENLFFAFGADRPAARRALRELGNFHVTSAYKQLVATEDYKTGQKDGGTFCALFISARGYDRLGLAFTPPPGNSAFTAGGMKADTSLGDPAVTAWQPEFQQDIDGMVLVADDDLGRGAVEVAKVTRILEKAGCTIVARQTGTALRNAAGNGLEHFGYVDGRSQPMMLLEDIDRESRAEGIAHWDPTAALDRALVEDPLANDPDRLAFGSFFVFRKLEQRVRAFKRQEWALVDALGLASADRELAGAMVVGRFEDGTPVTMSDQPRGVAAPRNDFNYDTDAAGARCPFHAHIRKTNPRGSGGFEDPAAEQRHIMPRRGITYADIPRLRHPDGLPEAETPEEFEAIVAPLLPEDGVGLLFMAYNARLDDQFVFTQRTWANNANFPSAPAGLTPGLDGVIGQPTTPGDSHTYAGAWDDSAATPIGFAGFNGFVHMRGGEYFFAPSLHFLRGL